MVSKQLPALLTVEQVAEQLGISRARCYQLIKPKDQPPTIPSVTVGRLRRVAATDLEDYVARLRSASTERGASA